MRRTDRRRRLNRIPRASQIILDERQSLQNVLRLLRSCRVSRQRLRLEERVLRELIRLRTAELNRINADWDRKVRLATNRRTPAATINRLARSLPKDDYYLARLVSEHPRIAPPALARLARHPYAAARENVARHPKTPVSTLRALAKVSRPPLWYLVAFNPGTPPKLREKLRARMRRRTARLG